MYDKIVVVTRKTRLAELVERFNTQAQAKFYIEHAGGNFDDYVLEDDTYRRNLDQLRRDLELGIKLQLVDRGFVPTFLFANTDLIVTVGQDGLVANTAKYVGANPLVAVNPDPSRFDGVLLPFRVPDAVSAVRAVMNETASFRRVTLAEASLNDGQRLLAFNDLFIGVQTHVSARYRIQVRDVSESQSSSGVLVSTGAGSTGWLSSMFNMAAGIAAFAGGQIGPAWRLAWDDRRLVFVVREPFQSKCSGASLVAGVLDPETPMVLESLMPTNGTIFSDGVEADYLPFNSGSIVKIRASTQSARLVVPAAAAPAA